MESHGRHTGRTDVPLTEEGEREARAVGEMLRGREFVLLLSTPLRRALDTARLAGFEPESATTWPSGTTASKTASRPDIREQVPDWTIWRYGAKGGETVEQLAARANRVLAELLAVDGDVSSSRTATSCGC